MTGPGSLPLSKAQPSASNPFSQVATVEISGQQLYDRIKSAANATSTLLKSTKWPRESELVVQDLLKIINIVPDHPLETVIAKETAEQSIQILEAAHARVKEAYEKYGTTERGFRDTIKYKMSSLRPNKCTDTLRTCRADIEKASTMLHSCLGSSKMIDPTSSGSYGDSEMPSGSQSQPNIPLVKSESDPEPSTLLQDPQTQSKDPILDSDPPAGDKTPDPIPSADAPPDQESFSPVRRGGITAAKKTFETVEAVSGAIPVVGGFVRVAAKVGSAFVNMIETMDQNNDVSKELEHHASKLSEYIEHVKKTSDAENGSDLIIHIDNIHRELKCVQEKVNQWNSTDRLKKAFLSSEHAEELKGYQNKLQTTLEELQLLVGLKTSDLVIELKNTELRAERRRLLACLGDGSYGARGNSVGDVICLAGTRVNILGCIEKWVKDTSDTTERVLWIRGMAGRGKSTIASTVAHNWASKGSCAIFHFRRGQNSFDGQFICALARQFGKGLVPEVKNAILDCVKENEDIAKERLDQQFKTLIVGALGKLQNHAHPILIIVDALDECANVTDAVRFVRLIDQHSSSLPTNVKFLLTCRPEAPLLVALEPRKWYAEDLDSTSHVSDEDITRFVQNTCAQIRDDHDLPETWPSSHDLRSIVRMSQGLFQWARTALTYIQDRSPDHRLQELLQRPSTWSGLDDLYHQILSKAFNEVETDSIRRQLLSWVLGTLVVAPYPVSLEVVAFLYADHAVFKGQKNVVQFLKKDILADLNSLLHIPTSSSEPVRLMHTSIRDLLTARNRCENRHYFIDPTEDHRRLAGVSFQLMKRDLKQNICNLPHYLMANSSIQDKVEDHVSKGLRYCCRSWYIHLTDGVTVSEPTINATSTVLAGFKVLSKEKLLAWLEVMSLIGVTTEALMGAQQVYQWLLKWPDSMSDGSLVSLWRDIQQFINVFFEPISFGALHIYASALPQCPVRTQLWAHYGSQVTTRVIFGERQLNWSANIWAFSGGSGVREVVFSPDGSLLASASGYEVQLRDVQTGAPVGGPLRGHGKWVSSVAFSPDGKVLASGSADKTVRLWDAQTGAPLGSPLTGHSDWINSIAFSPDGKVLASGSNDETVRLWDARTGVPFCGPLTGHSGSVKSVAFSPDGKVLASGSWDCTIRLWDTQTGAPLRSLLTGRRDYGWIDSVVFSPDGKVLASGSRDCVIQLWDARTGAPLGGPLKGHSSLNASGVVLRIALPVFGWITSLVFSPEGRLVASRLDNKLVRLWGAQAGAILDDSLLDVGRSLVMCMCHIMLRWAPVTMTQPRHFVMFQRSPPIVHQWIAPIVLLGTAHAVELWFINMMLCWSPSRMFWWIPCILFPWIVPVMSWYIFAESHSRSVTSVVFSPDGKLLASGSYDKTVQLWDARTGARVGEPLIGHSDSINSIVFSPDSKVLASGSDDKTVRLWDIQTGAPLGYPLTGHSNSITSLLFRRITSLVFSSYRKVVASGPGDKSVRLWDAQTGAPMGDSLTGHRESVRSVAFSPDGKVLASGSADKTVRLWDVQTGAPSGYPLTGHSDGVHVIVFSPDGKVLASTSGGNFARTEARDSVTSFLWQILFELPQYRKVQASRSQDNTVRLWDAQTGAPLGDPLIGHSNSVNSIVFSPDSKVLASGSDDKTVRLWEARSGAPVGEPLTGHSESVNSIVFSPDSKALASGSADATVRLWDTQTGAPLGSPLTGHSKGINSVVFSPDGKVLASGSWDDTIRLWDARIGAPLGDPLIGHSDRVNSVVFSPDSKMVVSGSYDTTVRVWDAQTGALLSSFPTGPNGRIESVKPLQDYKTLTFGSPFHLWDPLSHRLGDGCPTGPPSPIVYGKSNWIFCGAERLLWILPQYGNRRGQPKMSSLGTLAIPFDKVIFIFDVSRSLMF